MAGSPVYERHSIIPPSRLLRHSTLSICSGTLTNAHGAEDIGQRACATGEDPETRSVGRDSRPATPAAGLSVLLERERSDPNEPARGEPAPPGGLTCGGAFQRPASTAYGGRAATRLEEDHVPDISAPSPASNDSGDQVHSALNPGALKFGGVLMRSVAVEGQGSH